MRPESTRLPAVAPFVIPFIVFATSFWSEFAFDGSVSAVADLRLENSSHLVITSGIDIVIQLSIDGVFHSIFYVGFSWFFLKGISMFDSAEFSCRGLPVVSP